VYGRLVAEYQAGNRSREEVEHTFKKRFEFAKRKLQQAEDADDTQSYVAWGDDLEALDAAWEALANTEQNVGGNNNAAHIHNFWGGTRELLWNFIIPADSEHAKKIVNASPNTLVILVDDNIDKSKSLVDAYRSMYKTDVVGNGNDTVIAAMLHSVK
jgi:phosphoribosylpyrophosphate synthetase